MGCINYLLYVMCNFFFFFSFLLKLVMLFLFYFNTLRAVFFFSLMHCYTSSPHLTFFSLPWGFCSHLSPSGWHPLTSPTYLLSLCCPLCVHHPEVLKSREKKCVLIYSLLTFLGTSMKRQQHLPVCVSLCACVCIAVSKWVWCVCMCVCFPAEEQACFLCIILVNTLENET